MAQKTKTVEKKERDNLLRMQLKNKKSEYVINFKLLNFKYHVLSSIFIHKLGFRHLLRVIPPPLRLCHSLS